MRALRNLPLLVRVGLAVLAIFALIQLVPYGHAHSNPPVTQAVRFDSGRTHQLAQEACFACHSNETKWPWDANVAPSSWLIEHDVHDGRQVLNFSEWDRAQPEAAEVVEQVGGGEMPPLQYRLVHPAARLSSTERRELAAGLARTYRNDPPAAVSGGG